MKFCILGPLAMDSDTTSLAPSAVKPRTLLALLVLRANTVVPTTELAQEIWADEPPRCAVNTLQSYVVQLRKLICSLADSSAPGTDAKQILSTRFGGYLLRVQQDETDLDVFNRSAKRGTDALLAGQYDSAAAELASALGLWRGPALADVQRGRLLELHARCLDQRRMSVLEQRIEADLHLGRHHAVLDELMALTAEQPLSENLHAQFMLALYRCGQRWKALSVFHDLRRALVEELGLEPGAELARLHHAMLNSSTALDVAGRTGTSSPVR